MLKYDECVRNERRAKTKGVMLRYVHRLACDILYWSVQFKLEGSNELKEKGFHPDKREGGTSEERTRPRKLSYSTRAKRYPIQALAPPMKLNVFPQTPGTIFPPGISLSHLSGLQWDELVNGY